MAAGPKGRRPASIERAAPSVGEANIDQIDLGPIIEAANDLAGALEAAAVGPPTEEVLGLCLVQAGSLLVRVERALPGYVRRPPGFNCGGSMNRMTVLGIFVSCARWTYEAVGWDASFDWQADLPTVAVKAANSELDRNRFNQLASWLRSAIESASGKAPKPKGKGKRGRKPATDRHESWRRLKAEGHSIVEIARQAKVHRSTVSHALRKLRSRP